MDVDYVEQRDEGYWLTDSRVSLDSIIYAFNEGAPLRIDTEYVPRIKPRTNLQGDHFLSSHRQEVDVYLTLSDKKERLAELI